MTLSEELSWRGFVNQTTYSDITALDSGPITFYWGVDPSAKSMTIGNFAMAMMVRHFIDHGHKAILLVGGATGLIGDPDGKSDERELKSIEQVEADKLGIIAQYQKIFAGKSFEVVDNYDWFKDLGYLEFLRLIGKHVPMRQMLNREFVQSRLGEGGSGISYAEFSYSLIQGFDFLHLNKEKGATLQVAGSDQWGNSIAGVDLIRRTTGKEAHVWTGPLVVNKSTGIKFGKSEDGAIWLDSELTSIFKFYQFWLNVDDEGVDGYLKIYTLITPEEHAHVMEEFAAQKSQRHAQKVLAYEVTKLVHGVVAADSVVLITAVLFGSGDVDDISPEDLVLMKSELPSIVARTGDTGSKLLLDTGLAQSSSEARRFIEQGGVTINGQKISADWVLRTTDGKVAGSALLRRGKNLYAVIDITA